MIIGVIVFVAIWTAMVALYPAYASGENRTLVLSFPISTTLMLYGIWGMPTFFVILYTVYFRKWIMTPEDSREFKALMERVNKKREGGA